MELPLRYVLWLKLQRIKVGPYGPRDFHVREVPVMRLERNGKHAIFLLKKVNRTTLSVLKEISSKCGIDLKEIGFAGMKDKCATSFQYISLPRSLALALEEVKLRNAKLTFVGYGRKIKLGNLVGNEFHIKLRLRDDEKRARSVLEKFEKCISDKLLPNYFGLQRFGRNLDNHLKGYELVKGMKSFRKERKILKLYLHALQAYLFNSALTSYINDFETPYRRKVKLVGYNTRLGRGMFDLYYRSILKELELNPEEFHIPWLRLTAEERKRKAFVSPMNFSWKIREGLLELNFRLPPGSYATILLNELTIGFDPRYEVLTS